MNITTIDNIPEGYKRIIVGPPDGDLTNDQVRACEMITKEDPLAGRIYRARFALDPGDIEDLQAGAAIWISLWGHVVPFDVDLGCVE